MDAPITRRHRGSRKSTGKRVRLQPRDLAVFRALHEHGPLPTPYLYEFAREHRESVAGFKNRLTILFHEENTDHNGPYLSRPGEDYNAVTKTEHEIYDITPAALHALEESGYVPQPRSFKGGLNPHQFMVSCTGASIELAARDNQALRLIPRHRILKDAPNQTLRIPCTVKYKGQTSTKGLTPDDVFGLEYLGEPTTYRLFAVEDDRGNEPLRRANLDETSYLGKILRYQKVIGEGLYKDHFGRKCGMLVLNITTTTAHMQGIIDLILELTNGEGLNYMLFKVAPSFGKRLSVPPVLKDLLNTPWQRAGYPPINISEP